MRPYLALSLLFALSTAPALAQTQTPSPSATPSTAQLKVIISGGFHPPYKTMLPEFERSSGISVHTGSGASQGSGPETIRAQLNRGVPADVLIMSKEGLTDLLQQGKVVPGSIVDLAQVPLGVSVRAGTPKPDISSPQAFAQTLLKAKLIVLPGSTSGMFLVKEVFPKLGVPASAIKQTARGLQATALLAAGEADLAVQPTSELLGQPGIEFVGTVPSDYQFVSVFSAGIVAGSTEVAAAQRLITFMASEKLAPAVKAAGMEPVKAR